MQSLHGTSALNDSGDRGGDTTENEAKGKCREAQIKGKKGGVRDKDQRENRV